MLRRTGVGIAATLVALLVLPEAAFARPAPPPGSVKIRTVDWVGLRVDIATLRRGVRFSLQPRQAYGSVTSLAPVTTHCSSCAAAVNADFFDVVTHEPIGGVIINGVVFRSPNARQNQLSIARSGRIQAGILGWRGEILIGDGAAVPLAVNDPAAASPILYDRRFGASTPARGAVELAFAPVGSTRLRLGHRLRFRYVGPHAPGGPIPPGQVIVSASGTSAPAIAALRDKLVARPAARSITVRLATDSPAWNSLGANHVLLAGGQIAPIGEHDHFVFGGHPRTLFGWDGNGKIMLVTVGSSAGTRRAGLSLPAAARLMLSLGATNAVNLDGGGSSTFVRRGRVLNNPSDGRERGVANAWIVLAQRPASRARRVASPARPRIDRALRPAARAAPKLIVPQPAVEKPLPTDPPRSRPAPVGPRPTPRPLVIPKLGPAGPQGIEVVASPTPARAERWIRPTAKVAVILMAPAIFATPGRLGPLLLLALLGSGIVMAKRTRRASGEGRARKGSSAP